MNNKIWLIIAINLFHQTAIYGTRPIIPMLAHQLGLGAFEIGLLASMFSIFPFFMAIKVGILVDKWGTKWPIIIGTIGVTTALVLPFLMPSIPILYLSQILAGASQILVNLSLQNLVGLASSASRRHYNIGWFTFATAGGQFIGPVCTGLVANYSDRLSYAFLTGAIVSLIPVIIGLRGLLSNGVKNEKTAVADQENQPVIEHSALQLLRIRGMHKAILASMSVQLTKEVMMTYFPLYAAQNGISPAEVGLIVGMQGLASMFVRLFQGPVTKYFKLNLVILTSLLLGGISFILLIISKEVLILSLLTCIIGFGLGLVQPISLAIVIELCPRGYSGKILGLRLTGNRLAQSLSPVAFGGIASLFGIKPVFSICGSLLTLGAFYISTGIQNTSTRQDEIKDG